MTYEIFVVLILLVIAMAGFAFEWIPAEVVALGLMLGFVVSGVLAPEAAFQGFANETVVMIMGLLIMTSVLARTGLMEAASRLLLRQTGDDPKRFLWLLLISIGVLSSFMSNTAATAFFIPVVIGVARRMKEQVSDYLLPMAFASILASSVTLIATSTNLVVSGIMKNQGLASLGMFELSPVGLPILVFGILYLVTVGRRLIPKRAKEESLDEGASIYTGEIIVLEESTFAGKTIAESRLGSDHDIQILRIVREKTEHLRARPEIVLEAGDVLLVKGAHQALIDIKNVTGLELKAEAKLESVVGEDGESKIVEAILLPGSTLIGRSLKQARFRERHGILVLGVQKAGWRVRKLTEVKFAIGDVLLLEGSPGDLAALQEQGAFRLIGEPATSTMPKRKAWILAGIFVAAIALGVLKILPLPVAVLTGAFAMLASRIVRSDEVLRDVEWKAVILIACMLSIGAALSESGADKLIAGWVAGVTEGLSPVWLLGLVFTITVGLSQPMSNQAAAALVLPIAAAAAVQLGYDPRPFAVTVAVAASCSFLTPLEPSCLMVYGPGGYRFKDFLIVGAPLTVVIFLITLLMVPWLWPF